jgi:hypothetical protein
VLDAYWAFVDHDAPNKAAIRSGEYFVFDRGDKIDYNHLTGDGHRRIADLALRTGFCTSSSGKDRSARRVPPKAEPARSEDSG